MALAIDGESGMAVAPGVPAGEGGTDATAVALGVALALGVAPGDGAIVGSALGAPALDEPAIGAALALPVAACDGRVSTTDLVGGTSTDVPSQPAATVAASASARNGRRTLISGEGGAT